MTLENPDLKQWDIYYFTKMALNNFIYGIDLNLEFWFLIYFGRGFDFQY